RLSVHALELPHVLAGRRLYRAALDLEPDLLGRAAASAAVLDSATITQHALAAFDYRPLAGPDTSCPAGSGWPGPVAAGCPAADTSAQYGHHSHGVQPGTNLSTARWKLEKPGPCPGFF